MKEKNSSLLIDAINYFNKSQQSILIIILNKLRIKGKYLKV